MTGTATPMVVGADGSESSLEAVVWAVRECARHRVSLRLVHVCAVPAVDYPDFMLSKNRVREAFEDQGLAVLAAAKSAAKDTASGVEVETAMVSGDVIPMLLE